MATKRFKHGVSRTKPNSTSVVHPVVEIDCAAWSAEVPPTQKTRGRFTFRSDTQTRANVDHPSRDFLPKKKRRSPFHMDPAEAKALVERLTPRERQVAELVALGLTLEDSAKKIGISTKVLALLHRNVCAKLGATTQGIARIWFCAQSA